MSEYVSEWKKWNVNGKFDVPSKMGKKKSKKRSKKSKKSKK